MDKEAPKSVNSWKDLTDAFAETAYQEVKKEVLALPEPIAFERQAYLYQQLNNYLFDRNVDFAAVGAEIQFSAVQQVFTELGEDELLAEVNKKLSSIDRKEKREIIDAEVRKALNPDSAIEYVGKSGALDKPQSVVTHKKDSFQPLKRAAGNKPN